MDLLGDQWTLLVLRDAYHGVRRFDKFQASLGIARNTLTERLDRLTGAGLLDRVRYQDRPARYEYPLTDMGRDFFPALAAIIRWGDTLARRRHRPARTAAAPRLRPPHRRRRALPPLRRHPRLERREFEPGPGLSTVEGIP